MEKKLSKKISTKTAKIGVIGLGYVGLPLAHAFAEEGFTVTGMDLDAGKVRKINRGKSYIGDLDSDSLSDVVAKKRLKATSSPNIFGSCDVIIICVPTPLNRYKDPDIQFIVSATEMIQKQLRPGQLIILESTTYPGTTEEVILPALEKSGYKVGKDFFLCFSPERIDPSNPKYKTRDIPKVVGGVTAACGRLARDLYQSIIQEVVLVSSSRTAEMTKLLENTFRIVNIGLINELARAAAGLKVDIWEAIEAAKTKPFGYMPFFPGPGIGGHCIGVDPIFLSWKSRMLGNELHFIELARRTNAEMPRYVVSQAIYALNKHKKKAVNNARILILGVSYKKDVADTRESPALDILTEFHGLGAKVAYHDPYVPELSEGKLKLKSQLLTPQLLKRQDLVILTSDHSCFDKEKIVSSATLIYDTRNAFKSFSEKHIVRL